MEPRKIVTLILMAAVMSLFFISCGQGSEKGKLSTELIKNPKSAQNVDADELPVIKFDTLFHNFGKIFEGEKVSYTFMFENTGKSDLLISDARASCGCTVPEYTQNPIEPGEKGRVEVTFNSRGRVGINNKSINVYANTQPNKTILTIRAEVLAPSE